MDVSAITKQTINEFLASLADRKLSKSTRNKHVGVIRKVLKHASDSRILKSLPTFPAIGQDANPRSWFDRNEYRKLRQTAQSYAKLKYVGHAYRGGPGCLNRFSASISGASAGVRLPSGGAAG